jgi:hypothetical protein
MVRISMGVLGCAVLVAAGLSVAEDFGNAVYDGGADELIVTVMYSGTNADHQFSLLWDPCVVHSDGTTDVTAQLVDSQERDEARQEYQKVVRLSLKGLTCRPARVTLHGSWRSFTALQVPAAP